MTINYIYAFVAVFVVSLVSLVGVFTISIKETLIKRYINIFISLAVGALLGDAFIHLIPEALGSFSNEATAGLLIIVGILIFFVIEKFLHWHHHDDDTDENHIHPVGKMVLFTDGFHNLIDGIIIGVSFLIDIHVGIATTIAVVLHEIPQEIGDFAVLIHSGYTKARALWLNFLSALTAVFGVILALALGGNAENFVKWIVPIAAGGFIYIAVADLIPELQKTKKIKYSLAQIFTVFLGIGSMLLLTLLE